MAMQTASQTLQDRGAVVRASLSWSFFGVGCPPIGETPAAADDDEAR